MIKFVWEPDPNNEFDLIATEMSVTNEATPDNLVEMFQRFLRACGYNPNIEAEVIYPERGC